MDVVSSISDFMLEQKVRGNSDATLEYYSTVLRFFVDYVGANSDLSDITLRTCKEYVVHLQLSPITSVSVQSYVRGLRAFLRWCYDNDYMEINICQKFKLPKATRKVIDVLTDEEVERLFNCFRSPGFLSARNRLIIALMLDSGLRLHEVVTLTVDSVHLSERYIIVQRGKGDKQRIVPIGSYTGALLESYFKEISWASCKPLIIKASDTRIVEPITDTTIKQLFRKLKDRSGIERLHPHLLRHTFATRYLENGGNIYTLQAILGHTSLEMVKRYLHLASSRIRADFTKYSPLDNLSKQKNSP